MNQSCFHKGTRWLGGKLFLWKLDVDGNAVGRENANPILDSRQYEVNFDSGEVTELTANVTAEQVYYQCDENGNDLLLLDYFIDYRKLELAMSLQYQKITVNGRACKKQSTSGWEICILFKD